MDCAAQAQRGRLFIETQLGIVDGTLVPSCDDLTRLLLDGILTLVLLNLPGVHAIGNAAQIHRRLNRIMAMPRVQAWFGDAIKLAKHAAGMLSLQGIEIPEYRAECYCLAFRPTGHMHSESIGIHSRTIRVWSIVDDHF